MLLALRDEEEKEEQDKASWVETQEGIDAEEDAKEELQHEEFRALIESFKPTKD